MEIVFSNDSPPVVPILQAGGRGKFVMYTNPRGETVAEVFPNGIYHSKKIKDLGVTEETLEGAGICSMDAAFCFWGSNTCQQLLGRDHPEDTERAEALLIEFRTKLLALLNPGQG